ncbi:MAG: DNA polymerase domain-containing protein, partial [Candidatus Nanohaloarchaea archaeon]|nr:DNA polymerase domain-containing protein [Candidatus Nanohaloarchaea archaeon]
ELRETDDHERIDTLQGKSDAIKWILVSCFGYQGFSNSKWGQLRVHEAINAYAREILLDAKEVFEQHGYRVVHGIVDSIWIQPRDNEDQTPIEDVCSQVSEEAGIRLDREHHYDWIAFCPKRETGGGALTRYFGKHRDGFKVRGIEARQRSTPPYIEDCQRAMLDLLDRHHDPDAVIDFVQRQIHRLETGAIDPERLLITKRISRKPDEYTQSIKSAAAVKRARELHDHHIKPGMSVEYVVVDDDQDGIGRVRLPYEEVHDYDAGFYREQLVRATESVLSPFGWDHNDVAEAVAETTASDLRSFLEVTP